MPCVCRYYALIKYILAHYFVISCRLLAIAEYNVCKLRVSAVRAINLPQKGHKVWHINVQKVQVVLHLEWCML
jgi:hypothetical protein